MSAVLERVKNQLQALNHSMLESEGRFRPWLDMVHSSQYKSACNLLHYLTLRSHDIRKMQNNLHKYGLSSLASSESHIRSQILEILKRLHTAPNDDPGITFKKSKKILKNRARRLFGNVSAPGIPSIMVTFDSKYADDYAAVNNVLQRGMNIARINCAHDDEETWLKMIEHVKRASIVTGLPCKIYMDLPGPKIRTYIPGKKKKKKKRKKKKRKSDKPGIKVGEGKIIYLSEKSLASRKKSIIASTLPGITSLLQKGERVLIDDGLIETKVIRVCKDSVQLQVVRASGKKPAIRTGKGINLPDTKLSLPSLTPYDLQHLEFIQQHADIVGYSFVRNATDLLALQRAMTIKRLPVILKIETPEAVNNLPELLLQGMREELFGIMIARGDLAVEIGFERMSEIQEEILWICDAGHVPVIWATQVLETMNKSGIATRSEVTDAAHAIMAECVLINKGSHTIEVIQALKDILYRSGGHRAKKRYTFRPLSIARNFIRPDNPFWDA